MSLLRLEYFKGYLFALCFAVLTYLFFVLIINNDEQYFTLPLEIIESSRFVASTAIEPTITLKVRGSPAALSRLSRDDMSVVLDLSDVQFAGLNTQQVELQRIGTLEQIDNLEISIEPAIIDVMLEPILIKQIDIQPAFSNSLPRGYLLESYSVRPATVEFSGPNSIISNINNVLTAEIDLGLFNKPTTRTVSLEVPEYTALESLPENEVQVFINVQVVEVVQTFNRVIVDINNVSSNLRVENTRNFVSLVVQGPQLIIERLVPEVYIDLAAIQEVGIYSLDLQSTLPASLEIISLEPEKLSIELVAAAATSSTSQNPSDIFPINDLPETEKEVPQLTPSPNLAPSITPDLENPTDLADPSSPPSNIDAPAFIPSEE